MLVVFYFVVEYCVYFGGMFCWLFLVILLLCFLMYVFMYKGYGGYGGFGSYGCDGNVDDIFYG